MAFLMGVFTVRSPGKGRKQMCLPFVEPLVQGLCRASADDERGKWQYKTEKEYLCMKNGEERGFTASEFRTAQNDGWEKQYPYKVGKKKVYMTPSAAEAQGLVRADKHSKSTRYGRRDNSLCTEIKSSIEILSVNEKEMTLSGNHVKGGGSYESPSLYMGHVVERCADRSTGRLLQISYVVHVVLIPAFFL